MNFAEEFKDACGFGVLAQIGNRPSHALVEDAIRALARMMHRGAVAADGKIFCGSQQGDLIVLKLGEKFEQLSANKLDSAINASPAIGDGRIYMRTEKMLWCIGAKGAPLP